MDHKTRLQVVTALRAAAAKLSSPKVKIGKFEADGPEFAEADILLDGVRVGSITKMRADLFTSSSSRGRKWVTYGYEAYLDDKEAQNRLENSDTGERVELRFNDRNTATIGDIKELLDEFKQSIAKALRPDD